MKKLIISLFAFTGFLFPLLAQVDHELTESEEVPVESLTLKKDQVPPAIVKAVTSDFQNGQAFMYGKFPYVLEKFAWVIDQDAKELKPDLFEAYIKTSDGSRIYAIYKPDGTIVQSRTIRVNAALPRDVGEALAKSQYKDWKVVGDKEFIKYFNSKNNIEEHVKVTVEKDNVKKNISFNFDEPVKN